MLGAQVTGALTSIQQLRPQVKVVVLIAHDNEPCVQAMLALGALGLVLKDEKPAAILRAIRAVATGDGWLSERVVRRLAEREPDQAMPRLREPLTRRESQVLRLLSDGKSDLQVAAELGIKRTTVRYHLRNLFDKLGVSCRVEAVLQAQRWGLVGEGDVTP